MRLSAQGGGGSGPAAGPGQHAHHGAAAKVDGRQARASLAICRFVSAMCYHSQASHFKPLMTLSFPASFAMQGGDRRRRLAAAAAGRRRRQAQAAGGQLHLCAARRGSACAHDVWRQQGASPGRRWRRQVQPVMMAELLLRRSAVWEAHLCAPSPIAILDSVSQLQVSQE